MFRALIERASRRLPARCAICHAWPSQVVCNACVARFAQPVPRCATCALPVPEGVTRCGACLREPPPLDACLAAVSYDWPWSDCVTRFKFGNQPGWAAELATVMRSAPWVEPALEQSDRVLPMPLARERLAERDEFVRVLAHEVRQPLNNASAALQSALSGLPAEDGAWYGGGDTYSLAALTDRDSLPYTYDALFAP